MIGTWLRLRSCRHTSMPESFGQHHVEQHEVGVDGVEQVERLGAVAGHLDPEALALEADGEGVDEGLLVLDDQHGASGSVIGSRLPRGDRRRDEPVAVLAERDAEGERRALALDATSTATSPPWLSATWRTMARPRPVPPVSRLRARSTR